MEKVVLPNKYHIKKEIHSLAFLNDLIKPENDVIIYGDLEIEPFTGFSIAFQAVYWYLKYELTQKEKVKLEVGYGALFCEDEINVIWLTITDEKHFRLECRDGDWFVSFSNLDNEIFSFFIDSGLKIF